MAVNVQKRGNKFQLRVTHPLLPKAFFATFADEASAHSYGAGLQAMLDRGVVPAELLQEEEKRAGMLVTKMLDAYITTASPSPAPTDMDTLRLLKKELDRTLRTSDITTRWVDAWVKHMKVGMHLAPSTLRKRVESLARAMDWYIRMHTKDGEQAMPNPLRNLPRGYSAYAPGEVEELQAKDGTKQAKIDRERNRRLAPEEEERIRAALNGVKREDRERALASDPAFILLFDLIVDTGLRLSEALRLRVEQYDSKRVLLNVEGSKGHRGKMKPRVVPLTPGLHGKLQEWCKERTDPTGLIFPFWKPDTEPLSIASHGVAKRFKALFDYAKVPDCTEHDLRHEATCRWITMRTKSGAWMWGEAEICKIMGWSNNKMLMRYLSLRGEDFSNRMMT